MNPKRCWNWRKLLMLFFSIIDLNFVENFSFHLDKIDPSFWTTYLVMWQDSILRITLSKKCHLIFWEVWALNSIPFKIFISQGITIFCEIRGKLVVLRLPSQTIATAGEIFEPKITQNVVEIGENCLCYFSQLLW